MGKKLPQHIKSVKAEGIRQVKLIDATPIGINVRSTVATYASIHDELRKIYAQTPDAKQCGYKAGDFSYNTGDLRCPTCDGTGQISLDVQFLPDVDIVCPDCKGSRYKREAYKVLRTAKNGEKIQSAPADEYEYRPSNRGNYRFEVSKSKTTSVTTVRIGLFVAWRRYPRTFGRRSPTPKVSQRNGQRTKRYHFCI